MKKPRYVLLMTIPFLALGLNGCKKQEHQHKNVITGIGTFQGKKMLVLNDAETGQERFYEFADRHETAFFDCFHVNDTVKIITGGVYSGDSYYKDNIILYEDAVGMELKQDDLFVKTEGEKPTKEYEKFQVKKQQKMRNDKQK